jgi:hypothetical protein
MFQVLILVCSIGVAPADCQIETALDVVNGPLVASEMLCGLHGQAYIAQTSLRPASPGEYVKVKCLRPAKGEMARQDR